MCRGVSPRGGREHTMVTGAPDLGGDRFSHVQGFPSPVSWMKGHQQPSRLFAERFVVCTNVRIDKQYRYGRALPHLHRQFCNWSSMLPALHFDGEDDQSESTYDGAHADQLGGVAGRHAPLGIDPERLELRGYLLKVGIGEYGAPVPKSVWIPDGRAPDLVDRMGRGEHVEQQNVRTEALGKNTRIREGEFACGEAVERYQHATQVQVRVLITRDAWSAADTPGNEFMVGDY